MAGVDSEGWLEHLHVILTKNKETAGKTLDKEKGV